jgi:hypothetical protein
MAGTTSTNNSSTRITSNAGSYYSTASRISCGTRIFILEANDFRGSKKEEPEGYS